MDASSNAAGFHMADVRRKRPTLRRAVAVGELRAGPVGFAALAGKTLPKGDALAMAEVAGLQGAKNAAQLMPLCHPLSLEYVDVRCVPVPERHAIRVYCETSLTAKTGVEMEALAGASAALLTLYDLTKPVQPALAIEAVRLLFKEGGKKGLWIHPDGMDEAERAYYSPKADPRLDGETVAVVTLSDRAAAGVYQDRSGELLDEHLQAMGANVRMSPGVRLHHKVIVIDRETVVLGSANFSGSALDRNDENVLIVKAPNFAQAMLREAIRCWRAEPYWITKWRTPLPAGM